MVSQVAGSMPAEYPAMGESYSPSCGGSGCSGLGCGGAGCVGPSFAEPAATERSQFWFSAEYILWWTKGVSLPPLVGTIPFSEANINPTPSQILVQQISSERLVSDNSIDYGAFSGMRLSTGVWFNKECSIGMDASYFQLESQENQLRHSSPGDPLLGPAFFDPVAGAYFIIADSVPGLRRAAFLAEGTQQLWGADANVLFQGCDFCCDNVSYLVGFRHLQLSESLDLLSRSTALAPNPDAGDTVSTFDKFGTHNQFYGAQVGFDFDWCECGWCIDWKVKVAVGDMQETVNIQGLTNSVISGVPSTVPGGVFALPTNIGRRQTSQFAVIPESTLNVGYQVARWLRIFAGYNYMYVSNVVRPAQQIDTTVNVSQIPSLTNFNPATPVSRPAFQYNFSDFWAQGINLGVEFRF
jgi:hypothetical protein